MFGLYAIQTLKLSRNTCFPGFKISLVVNSHVAKPEKLVLSKMGTSTFCLSKVAYIKTSGQSP